MFGLMRHTSCAQPDQPEWYRLHYCGVCKSIGRKYDQKSRLLLNFGAVFLAELLSLMQADGVSGWPESFSSYACFNLPECDKIPLPLSYAADVNMMFASLKSRDNQSDESYALWKAMDFIFRKPFARMEQAFQQWQMDKAFVEHWFGVNRKREQIGLQFNTLAIARNYFATPSAQLTAYFFGLGAKAMQRVDQTEAMEQLGYHFGELIYTLDAWEDLEKDVDAGRFNYIAHHGGGSADMALRDAAKADIWALAKQVEAALEALPIPAVSKNRMRSRLMLNLSARLEGKSMPLSRTPSGIEKAGIPRLRRKLRAAGTFLSPAHPGKFAVTYMLLLMITFGQDLAGAVSKSYTPSFEGHNIWLFGFAILFPVLTYTLSKTSGGILAWLEKQKERLSRKIAAQKKDPEKNEPFIFLLLLLLLLVIILAVNFIKNFELNICGDQDYNVDTSGCNTKE